MSSGLELIGLGMPAALANALGCVGMGTAVVAAANSSATGATLLVNDMSIIATSGASTNSVILPSAGANGPIYIGVASGQTTVNIFPATGETIIDEGAQGAANSAITLAASKNLVLFPHNTTWFAVRGA